MAARGSPARERLSSIKRGRAHLPLSVKLNFRSPTSPASPRLSRFTRSEVNSGVSLSARSDVSRELLVAHSADTTARWRQAARYHHPGAVQRHPTPTVGGAMRPAELSWALRQHPPEGVELIEPAAPDELDHEVLLYRFADPDAIPVRVTITLDFDAPAY